MAHCSWCVVLKQSGTPTHPHGAHPSSHPLLAIGLLLREVPVRENHANRTPMVATPDPRQSPTCVSMKPSPSGTSLISR